MASEIAADSRPAAVTARLCRPDSPVCERLPAPRISDELARPGALLWVDVRGPDAAALAMLREEFGFHHLALEDAAKQRQRPKVDEYPDYYFVVMYAPAAPAAAGEVETTEVDLFVGRNYVVSLREGEVPALEAALARWDHADAELRRDVGFLLHTIADSLIDAYFPIVDELEDRLDAVELGLFGDGRSFDAQAVLGIKRSLYTLRKAIYPLREVFNVFLRREQSLFSSDTLPYFQDVYDHVLRLLDILDVQRDMATGALEAQLSVVSNRLNETMQRLTVVAVCVAVMGAVFGAWGMNFDEVPLQHLGPVGFLLVCGATGVLVGLALWWARRQGLW